jgi:hypothetical protein
VGQAPELLMGLIKEKSSEAMFIKVNHAPWQFIRWAIVMLLCRDTGLHWNNVSLSVRSNY